MSMQIISGTTRFRIPGATAVAIGKFDGVHLGHRRLLDALLRQKEQGLSPTVFTFDPSPAVLFGKPGSPDAQELTTREEKRMIFARMGVETLVEYPLDMVTASILPEEFIWRILVEQMHAKYIAAGEDLSFGSGGTGDFRLLDALAPCFEYRTEVIDKVRRNGTVISSTAVRELVAKGCMEEAADLLGGPYSVLGEIVHGQKIGRTGAQQAGDLQRLRQPRLVHQGRPAPRRCCRRCRRSGRPRAAARTGASAPIEMPTPGSFDLV
jgi:riboflavin kinase/FMN adenylyltransferase